MSKRINPPLLNPLCPPPPLLKTSYPPLLTALLSPDLFCCPERVLAGEENRDIAVVFSPPVLICCSLMLPSHLSHQASGEYRQRATTTHAQCWKSCWREDQAASLKAGRAQTAANPKKKFSHGVREDGATERADEKFNKYAHMKNKNQKYGTE